jgi:hypothetical protein
MKKLTVMTLVAAALAVGICTQGYASDWDKAGKILTVIEGMRVVTGGKVDIIGTITGINKPRESSREVVYVKTYDGPGHGYAYQGPYRHNYPGHFSHQERVWVPHMVWKTRYIPRHTEYRPGYGEVVIEGHYEKFLAEEGGHWETVYARR